MLKDRKGRKVKQVPKVQKAHRVHKEKREILAHKGLLANKAPKVIRETQGLRDQQAQLDLLAQMVRRQVLELPQPQWTTPQELLASKSQRVVLIRQKFSPLHFPALKGKWVQLAHKERQGRKAKRVLRVRRTP